MRLRRAAPTVSTPRRGFAGFRFPAEVITVTARWYLWYGLSYRDVEELLAKRAIEVDQVTMYRWARRFPARCCRDLGGNAGFGRPR